MKILIFNSKKDIRSHFKKVGIDLELEYRTDPVVLKMFKAYQATAADGSKIDIYTPDILKYIRTKVEPFEYNAILFGWDPKEYGTEVKNTGGYATYEPVYLGTRIATFRNDSNAFMYMLHELKHLMCYHLTDLGKYTQDEMDITLVNGQYKNYWKNDRPDDPDSNHQRTLRNIATNKEYLSLYPPTLKMGAKGAWVLPFQWLLNICGASLFLDGDFGKKTDMAVRKFQEVHKLKVDGLAGKKTIKALVRI